jgi:hypothetical protein
MSQSKRLETWGVNASDDGREKYFAYCGAAE